ncbi:MAG: hypothetical protein NT084_04495 [Bacteroidetes bacterium]|nr:hypothetical protein [Bacteroidota bacterium]
MKSSLHTDHLSPKELSDLISGKTDAKSNERVKKLLNDCELSKEALAGFTAIPDALNDLPSLKKEIAAKAGIVRTPMWVSVATVVIGVSLVVGMAYALWPHESAVSQIPNEIPETILPSVSSPATQIVDLTPRAEHFVNPEAKPKEQATISQGKVADTTSKSNNGTQESVPVLPEDKIDVKPIVPQHPEVGYNGSVGFILDLKVTEFEKYYRKTIEVREPKLGGVPAQFEDEKKKAEDGTDKETVRNVPAELFLNEGLRAFHDAHYGRCIEKMEVLKTNNANDINALFYMGVSYVKLEMFNKAIPLFDQILNSSNNVFHEEANWYKALALIGNGDKDAAKKVLIEISQKDGFYKEKAASKLAEW